ncbi:hypothetical protein BEWA_054160 [Theileria equi strain WA]|uniref:Uncharacterized protein n=1 Tax=Theileria equi strain WA TaxID=1537102 RepID=L1LDN8_THEEQ|nr:hypothetical protein BEWA_054160 [Theileria equi strain WA]EKX73360.1 hypothetical protein BEWA_054160 [Theileria equi strain WA]|eukprot:XP_004832812.1 hypothetical protein BEWA_054160 [Theileria equi strain WA]
MAWPPLPPVSPKKKVETKEKSPEEQEKEFKEKRKEARTKLEGEIKKVKEKPVEDRKEKYEKKTDGTVEQWLAKSCAVETGIKLLYEEAKAKVNTVKDKDRKKHFTTELEKIKKNVDTVSKDIEEIKKVMTSEDPKLIEKALGYFLAHYRIRSMVKTDVTDLILEIDREQGTGDDVINTLDRYLTVLKNSALDK